MSAVGRKRTFAVQHAAQEREGRVAQRQSEYRQRDKERHRRMELEQPLDREQRHHVAQNSAPVSPMNIFAGLELKGRNPKQEPTIMAVSIAET